MAVAKAFSIAFENWRALPTTASEIEKNIINMKENQQNNINQDVPKIKDVPQNVEEEKLIDFDDDSCEPEDDAFIFEPTPIRQNNITNQWVGRKYINNFNIFHNIDYHKLRIF